MSRRLPITSALFACYLVAPVLVCSVGLAQDSKAPDWKHGLEFRVRKAGEGDFDKNTKRYGAEVFVDANAHNAIHISETGSIGVAPDSTKPEAGKGTVKPPTWLHGLELKVRKAGESEFTDKTAKFGIEVFKDENTGNLIYVSQTGDMAVLKSPNLAVAPEPKPPTRLHGLDLKVRKGGEVDFTKDTGRYGIEVYKDDNTGCLVYISETGTLAVIPAGKVDGHKPPTWLHGLEFRVRKAGETEFTPKTTSFGAEIFKDENAGNLVYITQTGSISVVPAGNATAGDTKAPKWLAGAELKVRKAGESDFTDSTKKYGGEVFTDLNTNNNVYVMETGAIAVSTPR